jgi:hypothetical protein
MKHTTRQAFAPHPSRRFIFRQLTVLAVLLALALVNIGSTSASRSSGAGVVTQKSRPNSTFDVSGFRREHGAKEAPPFVPASRPGAGASASVTFPSTVTVGDTGLPASITLTNQNTAPNTNDTNTVCREEDSSPPCGPSARGIVLVPSCFQVSGDQCTAAGADPGVFQISSTPTGRAGTSCESRTFNANVIDATFGTVRFTLGLAGLHVMLPGTGSTCIIDFTVDVLKPPAGDADPSTPGIQTLQTTEHTQIIGEFEPGALKVVARGTSTGTTVLGDALPPTTSLPWSTTGNSGATEDESNPAKPTYTNQTAAINGGPLGLYVLRYDVTAELGLFNSANGFMRVRVRDNGPGANVLVVLRRSNISAGGIETIAIFDSDSIGASSGFQTPAATLFTHTFDFAHYLYWLEVTLNRIDGTGVPGFGGAMIGTS